MQHQKPIAFALMHILKPVMLLGLLLSATHCSDSLPVPQRQSPQLEDAGTDRLGTLRLALQDEALGHVYRLQSATFVLSGPVSRTLQHDKQDTAEQLSTELEVGSYTISLEPGWQLVNESDVALNASVRSERLSFEVAKGKTSNVHFEFTLTDTAPPAAGSLSISFQVSEAPMSGVLFSELMPDPAAHADSAGEWLELTNLGAEAFSLDGCILARDTQRFTIVGAHQVLAGATFTLANSADPGFTPDLVYQSLSLPNSAAYVLSLTCNGKTIDSVSVSPDQWHTASGKSLSYFSATPSALDNDLPAHWCAAPVSFGTDFGSPGKLNPACP
jgi:hypothetical protein